MREDEERLLKCSSDNPGSSLDLSYTPPSPRKRRICNKFREQSCLLASIAWLLGTLALLLAALLLQNRPQTIIAPDAQLVYSPAQASVRYKEIVFKSAFKDETPYQGEPSPKLDKAWENLYNFGISRIPYEQAIRLPNATSAIPGDESHYIVELDVFHQLHCLNRIRKALSPGYYTQEQHGEDAEVEKTHISHCIDHIRQGIMCNADISTVYWSWSKEKKKAMADARITHTCRDFEAIREWALERKLEEFDDEIYVPGSPIHE